jgi:hypothetical protein
MSGKGHGGRSNDSQHQLCLQQHQTRLCITFAAACLVLVVVQLVAVASLYLGCKVQESPKYLRDVIRCAETRKWAKWCDEHPLERRKWEDPVRAVCWDDWENGVQHFDFGGEQARCVWGGSRCACAPWVLHAGRPQRPEQLDSCLFV